MANILMINLPFAGHTNPTLPLAEALVKRGHNVSYINAEDYRGKIEKTGARFIPYKNYPDNPTQQQKKTMCFKAAFDTAMSLKQQFDLLIYEMFFYPGIKIGQNLCIPCVRQFSQPAWNEKTYADSTWILKLSGYLIDYQVMGKKNKKYMGLTNKSLHEALIYDKPELNIVYVPQMFQAHRELFEDDYVYTIPVNDNIIATKTIPYNEMNKPIVYISLGSIISNRGFCKMIIRAFRGKNMSIILNTGRIDPKSLNNIPENIYAYSFVPQLEVLHHADVFLTHCGMNSVNEAMMYGVPMVTMPFMNDQLSNAKRIIELGIGKRVRSFPSCSRQIYNTVKEVSSNELMRNRSMELRDLMNKENAFGKIILRVESLVN